MIEILLDFGSSVLTTDKSDCHTPLDLAFKFQAKNDFRELSQKIIKLLESKQDNTKKVKSSNLYYEADTYTKYMIPIDKVINLDDYIYQIFEMENSF